LIVLAAVLLLGIAALTLVLKVAIAWLVLPLAAWAGVLLLRPGQLDVKRFVLFLVGAGLTLTLVVEIVVFVGDVGRMNTVFKLYLEVWTLFAISAAASSVGCSRTSSCGGRAGGSPGRRSWPYWSSRLRSTRFWAGWPR
jgi:uncharacterized membrane protein